MKSITNEAAWAEVNACNDRRRSSLVATAARASTTVAVVLITSDDVDPIPSLSDLGEQWCPPSRVLMSASADVGAKISPQLAEIKVCSMLVDPINQAIRGIDAENVLLLGPGCRLCPDLLAESVAYLEREPETDLLYYDEGCRHASGTWSDLTFKPDWAPELLLSYMYLGHAFLVRRATFLAVGGLRKLGMPGLHDLALRVGEIARHVGHVPRPLFYCRDGFPCPTVSGEECAEVVREALGRRGMRGDVRATELHYRGSEPVMAVDFPDDGPSVAVIIPTRNRHDLLDVCLRSLGRTTYRNFRVYIIDNESDDPDTVAFLARCGHAVLPISRPGGRFNFAHINNVAARHVAEELLLFLNDDTEVINPRWLSQMVGWLQDPQIGSVGARLIFPDGRIQHAGVVHNISHGFPAPAFKLVDAKEDGYLLYTRVARNYLACTAACLLTPRELFLRTGGFDEERFSVAYNDADYGYRVHAAGYRNVFSPDAELYHFEKATSGSGDNPSEEANYLRKYRRMRDPYYNPNLAQGVTDFRIGSRTVVTCPPPRFRALMVMHDLAHGGASRSALEIASGLRDAGSIDPVMFSHLDGELRQEAERREIPVTVLPHFHLLFAKTWEMAEEKLDEMAEWVRAARVDLIYANTVLGFWAIAVAKRLGLPSIWNIRESEPPFSHFDEHTPIVKALAQKCLAFPYQVVFVSDATRSVFAPLATHNNFHVIRNGLDVNALERRCGLGTRAQARRRYLLEENELLVLIVGTVCERKGQIDLVRAMGSLPTEIVGRVRVAIVGDRPSRYSDDMHQCIRGLPEERRRRITVVPETSDIGDFYRAADIFVCSSRIESLPRIIQEAMYFGLPIVTTPVFGIPEQVRDGVSALFYEPGDHMLLARQIGRLAADADLRASLGASARTSLDILPSFADMLSDYRHIFAEAWLSGCPRAGA